MLFISVSLHGNIFYWFWRERFTDQYGPRFSILAPSLLCESQVWYLCNAHTETFYLVYGMLMALFFNELSHRSLPEKEGSFKRWIVPCVKNSRKTSLLLVFSSLHFTQFVQQKLMYKYYVKSIMRWRVAHSLGIKPVNESNHWSLEVATSTETTEFY